MAGEPVLIAGAGPVGLTAALELARFQVPTVVVEAKPELEPIGSRALVLARHALATFQRLGCDEIPCKGVVLARARTYLRETELFTVEFPPAAKGELPAFVEKIGRFLARDNDAEHRLRLFNKRAQDEAKIEAGYSLRITVPEADELIQVDERFVERIAVDNLTMDMVDLLKHGKAPNLAQPCEKTGRGNNANELPTDSRFAGGDAGRWDSYDCGHARVCPDGSR